MIHWRICYDDESTYSNEDGPWVDAPDQGVICVVVRDPTEQWGRWVNSGYSPIRKDQGSPDEKMLPLEMYVKYPDDEEPFPTNDLEPFTDRMLTVFGIEDVDPYVKFGRETNQLNWQAIMKAASEDPDFPVGSPRRRNSDGP